ncbi:MAG: hypothetical protein L7S57_06440, partial [Luminiphilus sp.]|nr:hypothetical protein [Luminiphilus sp.]
MIESLSTDLVTSYNLRAKDQGAIFKASALTNSWEEEISVLEAYRDHVADRAAMNIPPKPLSPQQV